MVSNENYSGDLPVTQSGLFNAGTVNFIKVN